MLSGLCAAHAAYERADFDRKGHVERLQEALRAPNPRLTIFIATLASQDVGYVSITEDFSTWAAKPFAHMDCLFVSEVARGQGIGKVLFEKATNFAREKGLNEIQWQTPDWNQQAIRFYQKVGATMSAKQRFRIALTHL
ncbi:MAG: GNAT family N-acetyltransferase [Notoacmeibacter sp.]